ncbi:MAG: hypothetical protein J6S89_05030 [Paludibacteraceae bacterium]|nr:hypothetical protein [Paludibacteraceae bacterium]
MRINRVLYSMLVCGFLSSMNALYSQRYDGEEFGDAVPVGQEVRPGVRLHTEESQADYKIDAKGNTILTRYINQDPNYYRPEVEKGSYAEWLLNRELYPVGYNTHLYGGSVKAHKCQVGVLKYDFIGKDLQQCADAAIRLRAEYLYEKEQYDKIHFKFTSGFRCDYKKWRMGFRVKFDTKSKATWVRSADLSYDYASFKEYLKLVFTYAGTYSLSKELVPVSIEDVKPGDVLIKGGMPGHVVTVMDVLKSKDNKTVKMMFSQSYMPAQEIEILKNADGSPWFTIDLKNDNAMIYTPEYVFYKNQFMRWADQ